MSLDLNNEELIAEEECCIVEGSDRKSHHSDKVKKNLVTRLNRVEGQIRGIKGLIEKDTYCDDVITQIAATQSALNSVAKILLEGHMKSCVLERIQEGDLEVLDEVLVTVQKLMKK
ncbi:CsoR family transcriptional regulator [Peribacillus cavernae]|jgi:DNA-binding FrmR family transcriptional regulator|uniref:CsoR family transcriptional regulator n=1 Tax=Peribacillus cavernae TaxID=1674310 RepID=A0A433HUM6_9BACI|nr:metal-sensitive transcriptional regulator [Peribacillus cavernae]MDQ0219966.1 DNA-binding FrmR family transcriptional regulator [Peribacillus cavernae]RUQ32032.1 CsoR family transcriptional regulator [Peribacillus cavernae]